MNDVVTAKRNCGRCSRRAQSDRIWYGAGPALRTILSPTGTVHLYEASGHTLCGLDSHRNGWHDYMDLLAASNQDSELKEES